MSRHGLLFKVSLALVSLLLSTTPSFAAESAPSYSNRESGLYRDVFDQNIYYEGTQYFHLERLYRDLFGIKRHALNVNVFDEVPNSPFFTNRHAEKPLSLEELKKGPAVTEGPDPNGKWLITKGKFEGISPGFFIRDGKGEKYLLKFDSMDNLELSTGAEVVTSRFLHAMGYNVPQYTLVYFDKDRLGVEAGSRVYDETGFRRKLTAERLEEFLLFVPETRKGTYRASASRILKGEVLGPMKFQGRRSDDPEDPVNHEERREIRALQVFSSWLNNNDVRESNSLDVLEEMDGRTQIRHYLIDFNSSLGATPRGPKPPQFGHEHMLDYGETLKAFLSLGLWKKPWQKRWDEVGREVSNPSVGYFDNHHFNPARYKTQLPYFPFKDLTRSDGFWAAKILMSFTDEDIHAIVSTGEYSDKQAEEVLAKTLIERRDLIGRFWFRQANPLDGFQLMDLGGGSYELRFEDLWEKYGFGSGEGNLYRFDVIAREENRGMRVVKEEVEEKTFRLGADLLDEHPSLDLLIRAKRQGDRAWSPFVRVEVRSDTNGPRIAGILHQD